MSAFFDLRSRRNILRNMHKLFVNSSLNIPYAEKDEAKKLGARWNPKIKKWYIKTSIDEQEKYLDFAKWLLKDTDEVLIAWEYIYIIEGQQYCWKCKHPTRVIGLGLSDITHLYGEVGDAHIEYSDEELHLAWVDQESDIPPKLLQYIKNTYSVKTAYSKTLGEKCFANHCDRCGALQGNWFLFDEPDSPLSSCVGGNELVERMKKLKIKCIPIDSELLLNWNVGFGSNDYAYFEYGHQEQLSLTDDPSDEYISYEELYNIH